MRLPSKESGLIMSFYFESHTNRPRVPQPPREGGRPKHLQLDVQEVVSADVGLAGGCGRGTEIRGKLDFETLCKM